VTDQRPTVSRFVLRKGAVAGQWMIWDRNIRGPAKLERGFATGLSEEQARRTLTQTHASSSVKRADRLVAFGWLFPGDGETVGVPVTPTR
jgi:hypothetical protein